MSKVVSMDQQALLRRLSTNDTAGNESHGYQALIEDQGPTGGDAA